MFEPAASNTAVNGGPKRYKPKQPQPPLTVPIGCTCFRLLCHASRIGGVIGKSGVIIKQLQHETLAKIRVEDPIPGSDDRVITVIANSSLNRTLLMNQNNNNYYSNTNKENGEEVIEVSAAQEALIRVFERILTVAAETDGQGQFGQQGLVSCRLLTDKSLIGSVIGKGGKVIEKLRKDFGCKIRVLVEDKLPSCALPNDEMVEIEGDVLAIKKALVAVARCLQDCPHANKTKMVIGGPHPGPLENIPNGHMDFPSVSSDVDTCPPINSQVPQHEIVFRMLCPNDRVGNLIGKSGTIIQAIKNESGANITIGAPVSDCDERLITISAMETLESRNSPAQNAVILVFNRTVDSSMGTPVSARILISPNQVGCLLGKGGSIIADMRKVTGAYMKIVGDNEVPMCALESDQVMLMTGEFVNVRDALYSITGRLRNNFFSSKMSNGPGIRNKNARGNGNYSNGHTNIIHGVDNLKLSSSVDRPPASAQWQSTMGASNPGNGRDVGTRSTSVKGGVELGSGSRSAMVTNVSVEITVPQNVIGSVYGENGSNLTRLRQISGAKVVVHEPCSGTTDHVVIISGTPDETQSAQSLLQAFILADSS
ncbi:KH domain-containing protein HEN4-like [Rutidosis leptorrhynchoides]|uniref:KH domain-containing protein HEN4-like n=1 Tax=Rutidosis leptorrhynchoides TaxID=125765 RepID=UPI003A98F173